MTRPVVFCGAPRGLSSTAAMAGDSVSELKPEMSTAAAIDTDKLIEYYRRKANVPPNAAVTVEGLSDSPIAGAKQGNRGFDAAAGEWREAEGKAYFVERPDLGYLKVSFFGPFYGAYVVFRLDADYRRFTREKSLRWNLAYAEGFEALTTAVAHASRPPPDEPGMVSGDLFATPPSVLLDAPDGPPEARLRRLIHAILAEYEDADAEHKLQLDALGLLPDAMQVPQDSSCLTSHRVTTRARSSWRPNSVRQSCRSS